MATLRLPAGLAGRRLAEQVVRANPGATWREVPEGIEVEGRRLEVRRDMVLQAYWPEGEADLHTAERFLRYLVRAEPRSVRVQTLDRLVVADEAEAEQPLLVRFPAPLKERLARTAERLGLSQNELVLRAVEDVVRFVEEFEHPAADNAGQQQEHGRRRQGSPAA